MAPEAEAASPLRWLAYSEEPPPGAEALDQIVQAFEAQAIPQAAWTHRAHVIVALAYTLRYQEPEATDRMRAGIMRLNASHGVQTTLERGYHETLTRFWMWAIRDYLDRLGSDVTLSDRIRGLLAYATADLPLAYYSRERLFSAEARFGWVEPDRSSDR